MVLAYLIGSFPTGVVIGKLFFAKDPRKGGSGASGATNVARQFGKKAGAFVTLIDAGKGALAVFLSQRLYLQFLKEGFGDNFFITSEAAAMAAAVCVVIGHVVPVFAGFKGGKGVATGAGALAALAPGAGLASALVFAFVLGLTGIVSLSSIAAALAYPLGLVCGIGGSERRPWLLYGSALLACLIIATHRSNLRRIMKGEEKAFEGLRFLRKKPMHTAAQNTDTASKDNNTKNER